MRESRVSEGHVVGLLGAAHNHIAQRAEGLVDRLGLAQGLGVPRYEFRFEEREREKKKVSLLCGKMKKRGGREEVAKRAIVSNGESHSFVRVVKGKGEREGGGSLGCDSAHPTR